MNWIAFVRDRKGADECLAKLASLHQTRWTSGMQLLELVLR